MARPKKTIETFEFHKPIEGLELSQSPLIDGIFPLLGKQNLIISIGTWKGGFEVFLRSVFPTAEIHTFDIVEVGSDKEIKLRKELFKKHNINYYIEDVFKSRKLLKLIQDNRNKLFLCDGGNKVNEFNYFARLLSKGDIIGMHDFAPDFEYFKKNIEWKKWNTSFESDEIRIQPSLRYVKRYKHFDKFLDVVWGMYERI